ncbi:MAG: glutamyl-tRNA reductase, partial [Candidatus Eremiobacteraeota bacterium]|nr:glutamyl-tRNA reductase [Candidatus Eremiobacteraeota bacterium]
IAEALRALSDYSAVREAAIVATCNRLEIYADVDAYELGVAQLKEFLTTYRNMRVEDFDKYLYTMLGAEAVEQLYRVASGLDSMLIGEPQIMSQVKEALRIAEEAGSIGPQLGRLFRTALQTGKRARTQTAIGDDVVSLGAAAVELAERHCNLCRTRCVVVGAGKMGATVAKHLLTRGAASVKIVNRTLDRAQVLAAQIGATAVSLDQLPQALKQCDLVITAAGSGRFLITEPMLRAALAGRRDARLLAVDIGVPRDVEPSCASVESAVIYSLEDLREVVDQSLESRRAEIPKVETIIAAQVESYVKWYRSRGVAPLIASLRSKAEQIRYAEIGRLFERMPELDEWQREMVIATSVSIINKLLHAPVTKLRETAAERALLDETQLAQMVADLDAFSDRLQRQLDARAAPLLGSKKNA